MTAFEFNRLLSKIKVNDEAFLTIYNYYYPRIILHMRSKYPDISAEDVAQDFFICLLNVKSFKYIFNPKAWVYKSCVNIAKKYFIGMNRVEIEHCQLKVEDYAIENLVVTEEINNIFDILGDDLTQKIFYLYYWEGYNLREISELLNQNKSTVKQKHVRGLKRLKKKLYSTYEWFYK